MVSERRPSSEVDAGGCPRRADGDLEGFSNWGGGREGAYGLMSVDTPDRMGRRVR